jgi:hypothetical protein
LNNSDGLLLAAACRFGRPSLARIGSQPMYAESGDGD